MYYYNLYDKIIEIIKNTFDLSTTQYLYLLLLSICCSIGFGATRASDSHGWGLCGTSNDLIIIKLVKFN